MPQPLWLVATAISYHLLKAKPDQAKKPLEEMFDPPSRKSIKSSLRLTAQSSLRQTPVPATSLMSCFNEHLPQTESHGLSCL